MRKMYVTVTARLVINADEGVKPSEILDEMDYNFSAPKGIEAEIIDTEILDWQVADSK